MAAPKGNNYSKGRKKGSQNKVTRELKEMIQNALEKAGGEEYLLEQALNNPSAFMTLLGKILPKDMNIGGQSDNPIKQMMEIVIVDPDVMHNALLLFGFILLRRRIMLSCYL